MLKALLPLIFCFSRYVLHSPVLNVLHFRTGRLSWESQQGACHSLIESAAEL